jgi:hypothetical protein
MPISYIKGKASGRSYPVRVPLKRKLRSQINSIQKKVSQLTTSTLRQSFTFNAAATITQAGVFTLLNGMATGDGDNQRNGNSIWIKRIECRCQVNFDAAALAATTAQAYVYRMMLIYDTQPNNQVIAIQDVLSNAGNNANNYLSSYDFNNVRNKVVSKQGRFKILYDETFVFTPMSNTRQAVGTTTYEAMSRNIVMKKAYKTGLITKYDNSTVGTVADINTGSLYMYECCNQNANIQSANRCQIVYYE